MENLFIIGDNIREVWIIVGDFNNKFNFKDRVGFRVILYEYQQFRDCVGYNGLINVKFKGCFYIWNNK